MKKLNLVKIMNRKKSFLILIFIFCSLGFAKDTFEYGGTTLFLENQYYNIGYRFEHSAMGKNMFQSTRTYVTGYYNYDEENKFRLTLDSSGINPLHNYGNIHDASVNNNTNTRVFAKYLYWESSSFSKWFDKLYVGQIETPWIGFEDKLWKKRFMAKSLLDLYGVTNSADRGVGIKSKVLGCGEYHIVIDGGNGYKVADVDNRYNLEGRYTQYLNESVALSIGGGTGWSALKGLTTLPSALQDWSEVARVDYIVGNIYFKNEKDLILSMSAYNKTIDKDGFDDGYIQQASGFSLTAVKPINAKLDFVARIDNNDPDIAIAGNRTQKTFTGVSYVFNDIVSLGFCRQSDRNEYGQHISAPSQVDYLQVQIIY